MRRVSVVVIAVVWLSTLGGLGRVGHAGTTPSRRETPPRHRITAEAARTIALARFPKGRVKTWELEKEGGYWLYSFDIATRGQSGIDEVHVDARSGKILRVQHETPRMEKKEHELDKKEAKSHSR